MYTVTMLFSRTLTWKYPKRLLTNCRLVTMYLLIAAPGTWWLAFRPPSYSTAKSTPKAVLTLAWLM